MLFEVDSALPLGDAVGQAHGLLGGAGVRLSGPRFGVDLALLRGGNVGGSLTPFIPYVVATYRHLP